MSQPEEKKAHGERHIEVFAEASTISGWRKQALAGQRDTRAFTLVADEGPYMPGGEGTAPTPLTYFVAGMALCVLSQVSNIAMRKKLSIRNERVIVTAHFLETGSILAGTKNGEAQRFEVAMHIESDEPAEAITDLMRMAHRMCFAEASITNSVPLTFTHALNNKPLELEIG
ncbi:MAG: OsmC family peroxiredoxin [Chloroflexi bacterium]|nr:OsmC family protein [Chloroflexota bacterium]MQC27138.1 OsmC family peroxiredoxin [Chloroflexota bacterium]